MDLYVTQNGRFCNPKIMNTYINVLKLKVKEKQLTVIRGVIVQDYYHTDGLYVYGISLNNKSINLDKSEQC